MTSSGFLLLAAVCFALIYGLFRLIRAAEDKSREIGFYYGFVGLFAHLVVPVLAPVLGVVFLIGVISLILAFSR